MRKRWILFILIGIFCTSYLIVIENKAMGSDYDSDKNIEQTFSEFSATGFFYVTKKDGIWWLINPGGEKFYSLGVSYVEPGDFFYGNTTEWANIAKSRLDSWKINTLNGGRTDIFPDMYYIYKFRFMDIVTEEGWTHRRMPDVFDSGWKNVVEDIIKNVTSNLRNDSNLIGYQTDNEMKWSPNPVDDNTNLEVFMSAGESTAGKKKVVEFLKNRYKNDTFAFNNVWNMGIINFNDLFNYTEFGKKGWKIYCGKAKEDIDNFSRIVAHEYFSFIDETLKKYDPNHLNLGVCLFYQGVPIEVLEECGKYVDIICVNYYRLNTLVYDPTMYFYSKLMNCVTLENWMLNYHLITGKPIISSEFTFPAKNDIWPIFRRKEFVDRGITVIAKYSLSQEQRADFYEWYAKNCLSKSYMVGHTWFTYRDKLNVVNWGLVDLWDEPYLPLVIKMKKINSIAIKIHENASKIDEGQYLHKNIDRLLNFNIFKILFKSLNCEDLLEFKTDNACFKNGFNAKKMAIWDKKSAYETNNYSPVLHVGGEGLGNFSCIQDAIDNACDGDTVFVQNGTYYETISINKSISLIGENKVSTTIIGNYDDLKFENVIGVENTKDITISGFTIIGEGGYFHDYYLRTCSGINIFKSYNCTVKDVILKNLSKYGIRGRLSKNVNVANNSIYDILDKEGCNIQFDKSNNVTIKNNYISHCTICCVWISRCDDVNIIENLVSNSYYCGIIIESSNNTEITLNNIEENEHTGLLLSNSNKNIIKSNNFLKKELGSITEIQNNSISIKFDRRLAFFHNSSENFWLSNYWNRGRNLPKIILGNNDKNIFIPKINCDWNPANNPIQNKWHMEELIV